MPPFGKSDTTKAAPIKRGSMSLDHNLYSILGETLLSGLKQGRLDPRAVDRLSDDFKANIGLELGGGYSANLGYNQYQGDRKQDLLLTLKKKF